MDRRDFLKVLGVVSIAPVVVAKAVESESDVVNFGRYGDLKFGTAGGCDLVVDGEVPTGSYLFDPDRSYGDFITISDIVDLDDPDDPVMLEAHRVLDEQITGFIPDGYRHRIHYVTTYGGGSADPLMQKTTLGWKYTPPRPLTATRVMMQERERLYFGANRSGKTDSHMYDCMTYGLQPVKLNWDV